MSVISHPADTWTPQQRAAIGARDVSVALSAGAGCGKTFVLTERFLAHFDPEDETALDPDDLGHLVAITFTERAAREMRDRIRQKCRQRLDDAPSHQAEYWSDLVRGLDSARISTIHAFCGALLRSHAVEAGLDPQFEVLDQAQADALLSETIDDCLRRLIAERDEATLDLAVRFDLPKLRGMIRSVVLQCSVEQLQACQATTPAQLVAEWAAFHARNVVPDICRQFAACDAARDVIRILTDESPDNAVMQRRRTALLKELPALADIANADALAKAFIAIRENARVQGGGSAKNWRNAEIYASFKTAAEDLRSAIDKLQPFTAFDSQAALEAARVSGQLVSLVVKVQESYSQRKQTLSSMDFNDLLGQARALLVDSRHEGLRKRLRSQIKLLLVDEFQDTDRLQVDLLHALCGEATSSDKLFIVGDYKQSIYRFRGADPDVFREVRQSTPLAGRLSLTRNFRSQPAILEFVNALFWDDLGPDYEPLKAEREQVSPKPAVEFMWVPMEDPKENSSVFRAREADWIARRIRGMLEAAAPVVWDAQAAAAGKPAARAPQPGDFAILFRALSDVHHYENALRGAGIDYYLVGGHAFYAQQEIFDLLNLLRTLNSRNDEVSLLGVLRSGFFSLPDETIFWLAQDKQSLAAGLEGPYYPVELSADQQSRVRFAARTIEKLRQAKDRVPICELIELALDLTGYDAILRTEFLGERKVANLRKVIDEARDFERPGVFSLGDYIAQLSEFVATQPQEPLAATHLENANVVRLMTIHQAKGLEFPIVIAPDVDRPSKNDTDGVAVDAELGLCVKVYGDYETERPLGGYELWQFREKEYELAEVYRLLYVATTRAADYLILSSSVRESGKGRGPWTELIASRFELDSGRCIASLPPDEPIPEVRVITERPAIGGSGRTRKKHADIEVMIDGLTSGEAVASPSVPGLAVIGPDLSARRQFSFSRLGGDLRHYAEQSGSEDADGALSVNARELGTLAHVVLAAIDFSKPRDIAALVKLHAGRQALASSAESAQVLEMVERFRKSPRAAQLAAAQESHAEVEFLLAWPPEKTSDQPTILTGYLDRLLQDASGDWHVLDFKTNRVAKGELAATAAPYEMQMLVYALATENILKTPPRTLTLHFLRSGEEFQFEWNDAARQRVVELVNQGIRDAQR